MHTIFIIDYITIKNENENNNNNNNNNNLYLTYQNIQRIFRHLK